MTTHAGLDLSHGFMRQIRSVLQQRSKEEIRSALQECSRDKVHVDSNNYASRADLNGKTIDSVMAPGITGLEDADIGNFVEDARPFIKQAMNDPGSLPSRKLQEVAYVIVNRGWEDPKYYVTAARLCSHLVQREHDQCPSDMIPNFKFRRAVLDACTLLIKDWDKMRRDKVQYWLSFVRFLWQAFVHIRPGGEIMGGLTKLLYEALLHLASPVCVNHFEELEVLTSILYECGSSLDACDPHAMHDVMRMMRDSFLDPGASEDMRCMLLPLIELHAGKWKLSSRAKKDYFGM